MIKDRDEIIRKLVDIQYERNEIDFKRGKFRVRVTYWRYSRLHLLTK